MKNKTTNIEKINLNLNINKDDSEFNDFLYCWEKFSTRPNKLIIHNTYSTKGFNDILSEYIQERNSTSELLPIEDDFVINDEMFVKLDDEIYCSYLVIDRRHENSIINEIVFLYSQENNLPKIQEIIEKLNSCIVDFCEEEARLSTISVSSNGVLEIEPITTDFDIENFDIFYNDKTSRDIKSLIKDIKKSDKGLSILYGERGSGKTSVINYISSKIDRIVIFIPNNMIEHTINNSEFRKFLKRYSKPVIIIDDCEMLMNEVFTKSNIFVNNLLQMIDGFLSDSIEVNIVAIFNIKSENDIDHSLLECNNLLRIIKFEDLTPEESTELSEHSGINKKYKTSNRVLDIIKNNKPKKINSVGL